MKRFKFLPTSAGKTAKPKMESGNAVIAVLVILVIVAVGALAYLSGQMAGQRHEAVAQSNAGAESASTSEASENGANAPARQAGLNVEPGNPVVAKIGEQEISRQEVFDYIQNLPDEVRQMPLEQLYPMALEQVINARLITVKTDGLNLDDNPKVKEQLEAARQQIVRSVYMQQEIESRLTDERLKKAYDQYLATFPETEEVKARHILVEDEAQAKSLIAELKGGASFEELAKTHSKDTTGQRGGDLGYFTKTDVVPEFGDVAFSTEVGSYTMEPVKTDFGYHVIKIEDKRMREPTSFEEAKPFLKAQMQRTALEELMQDWRDDTGIVRYDINGNEIMPAAGEEAAPATGAASQESPVVE